MSTDYRALPPVPFSQLFDGALAPFNVREQLSQHTTADHRCLTDGNNYVWVYRSTSGSALFSRYGLNCPTKILEAVCDAFGVEMLSEYEPQYWGFATQEEWDAAMEKMCAEGNKEFYNDVMCYVRGEEHNLRPGTIGMIEADLAKGLIANDPNLALPENQDVLLQAIRAAYRRDNEVVLTPEDLAKVRMYATHEEDLPKA